MNTDKDRCVIIGAGDIDTDFLKEFAWRPDDYVICADGGLHAALAADVTPCLIIGDLDSFQGRLPSEIPAVTCSAEKDDSDTMLALKHGLAAGFRHFVLLGATGGRFDHTFANLQAMAYGLDNGANVTIIDRQNKMFLLKNGEVKIPYIDNCYLSVFSYTPVCRGVTVSGVKYPLCDAKLTFAFPLGLSNEIVEGMASVCVKDGILLIVCSADR